MDVLGYYLVEGSPSGHCCFAWSVMRQFDDGSRESIAEAFEREDAEAIVRALNNEVRPR